MQVEKDIYVPMRDGVALAVDIYRPDSPGSGAAILTMTPYRKDPAPVSGPYLTPTGRRLPIPAPVPLDEQPAELEYTMGWAVKPYLDAGFVVVIADARGTGYSEGVYDYYNMVGGIHDGHDLVEWIAQQSWCNGRVGVMGTSAGGIYAYLTALAQPPHLVAMAANANPSDFYFDQWRPGGVLRYDSRFGWALAMRANTEPIDPGDPDSPSYERKRALYEARYRRQAERVAEGKGVIDLDWFTEHYEHRDYDDFWRRRSIQERISKVTVPTLQGGVWFDHFLRGTLTGYAALSVPKKLVVSVGGLETRLGPLADGLTDLTVEWFEHFLDGKDNGILDRPRARFHLSGADEYVETTDWPVPSTETELYLRSGPSGSVASLNDGLLATSPPTGEEPADELVHDPQSPVDSPLAVGDLADFERSVLTFTSESLSADLTVIGTPRLVLFATTDAADVDWCVRLCDVDASGRSVLLNTGALKGSHVESHERPTALEGGRVYRFDIEIWAVANVFRRGHRIRVDVSASDFPFFEVNPVPSRNSVFHDPERPSRLILPVVTDSRANGPAELAGRGA